MSHHPMKLAKDVAALLRIDPVAAGQVKEYIPRAELVALLGLEPSDETLLELLDARLTAKGISKEGRELFLNRAEEWLS